MDKYTYSLKAEKIQKLVRQEDYLEAAKIADTVDWKQEHNVRLLSAVSEAYENIGDYDKAIDVLLTAYERTSLGKRHIYKLTELALAADHIEDAEAFYRKYLEEAPDENNRYILRYKIAEAKGESIDKRITILETYKKYEFEEEWACRLAELYNEAGMEKECVALCDEIILWFGVGSYVDRAMELKELWQPLTDVQREHRENREYYAARVKAVANEMSEVAELGEEDQPEAEEGEIPEEDLSAEGELPVIAISPEVAGSGAETAAAPDEDASFPAGPETEEPETAPEEEVEFPIEMPEAEEEPAAAETAPAPEADEPADLFDPFDISSFEEKKDEPDFYEKDGRDFELPKLEEEEEEPEPAAGPAKDEKDDLERTRNLKDILRSTIGSQRDVRENLEPTKRVVIPQELLDEVDAAAGSAEAVKIAVPEVPEIPAAKVKLPEYETAAGSVKKAEKQAEAAALKALKPAAAQIRSAAEKTTDTTEDEMLYREDEVLYEDTTAEEASEPMTAKAAPIDEPLDSPFDEDLPAPGEQISLSADEGVLPVLSFDETERAVWEDQSRRRKETDPLAAKGMERLVFLTVAEGEDSVDAAVDALENYYSSRGRDIPAIARIAADKLNKRGLVRSLSQLSGKDLIIDHSSELSDDIIKEILRVVNHLDTGKVFVLTDRPDGVENTKQRLRNQIAANAEALGRDQNEPGPSQQDGQDQISERRAQRKVRKVEPLNFERINPDRELSGRDFIRYADFFAHKLECVLDESAFEALEDEVDIILREGGRLTPAEAEEIIEDAAESASKKLFGSKYDKDGFLILREKNFD